MERQINVAFVVNSLDVGGLEKVVISLANNLHRDRFTPHLICLDGPGQLAGEADVTPENRLVLERKQGKRLPIVGLGVDPTMFQRIRQFVRAKEIDVFHAHNIGPLIYAGVATRLIPMRRRPRIVYSDHNQLFSMTEARARRARWYLKLADQIVAVSEDLRRTLTGRLQAPPERVRVLYNGVDEARFARTDRNKVRRELGIADGELVVGGAASLLEHKGFAYLLDAAPAVLAKAPATRFVIAGGGPLRESLETQARALGIAGRVAFLGHRNDIPDVVSAFDISVLPSVTEGLPLALLEALATGNPIVCTRVGGCPEIVDDGVNGFLVPPRDSAALADRILQLHADRALRDAIRARNLEKFSRRFTLRAMIDAHEQMFSELVGDVRSRARAA